MISLLFAYVAISAPFDVVQKDKKFQEAIVQFKRIIPDFQTIQHTILDRFVLDGYEMTWSIQSHSHHLINFNNHKFDDSIIVEQHALPSYSISLGLKSSREPTIKFISTFDPNDIVFKNETHLFDAMFQLRFQCENQMEDHFDDEHFIQLEKNQYQRKNYYHEGKDLCHPSVTINSFYVNNEMMRGTDMVDRIVHFVQELFYNYKKASIRLGAGRLFLEKRQMTGAYFWANYGFEFRSSLKVPEAFEHRNNPLVSIKRDLFDIDWKIVNHPKYNQFLLLNEKLGQSEEDRDVMFSFLRGEGASLNDLFNMHYNQKTDVSNVMTPEQLERLSKIKYPWQMIYDEEFGHHWKKMLLSGEIIWHGQLMVNDPHSPGMKWRQCHQKLKKKYRGEEYHEKLRNAAVSFGADDWNCNEL